MGRDGTGSGYDFMEIFIIKFVLADVIVIAALLLADPIYAVAITALLVVSVFVTWYLTERVGGTRAVETDDGCFERLEKRRCSSASRGHGFDHLRLTDKNRFARDVLKRRPVETRGANVPDPVGVGAHVRAGR